MTGSNLGGGGLGLLRESPDAFGAGRFATTATSTHEWVVKIPCPEGHNFNRVLKAGVKAKAGVPQDLIKLLPGLMDKAFASVPDPDFEKLEDHLNIPANERTNMGDLGSQGDIEVSLLPGNRFKITIVALLTTELCPSREGIKGSVKEAMGRALANTRWGRGAFEIEVHDQFTKMSEVLGCGANRKSIAQALTVKHGDEKALQIVKAITFDGSWISDASKTKIGKIVKAAKDSGFNNIPQELTDALTKMAFRAVGK